MSDTPDLEARLRTHFEAEADGAGLDRLLATLSTGETGDLSLEEQAVLADYHRTAEQWAEPMAQPDAANAPSPIGVRPVRRVVGLWLAAAAALAALFLWTRGTTPDPTPVPGLRPMGDVFTLHVTVARDGVLRPIDARPLRAGDRLGLAYSAPAGHLRVMASSAAGVASLHPTADAATTIDGGQQVPLPAGAVLTPGDGCEWIVGLYATDPIPLDAARQAVLDAGIDRAPNAGCVLGPIALPGVVVEAVEIPR